MSTRAAASQEPCSRPSEALSEASKEFSVVLGGPLYQWLIRVGLVKPPLDRLAWRIIVISLVAWAPMLILTALSGRLTSGVNIPFLLDFEVHSRFLVALPLLIAAEAFINRRLQMILFEFVDRQIVTGEVLPKFERAIEAALRLRNSRAIELVLLVVVFTAGPLWWRGVLTIPSDTWYAVSNGWGFTPAGYWYRFASMPIVQFIALRWYFRLLIWGRLLWHVSRLDLNLVPSHPDRRGGLGFLGETVFALGPFLMAHSVLLAGYLANRVLYEGIRLPDHVVEIAVMASFLYLLALGPTCVFTPRLVRCRREGLAAYGALASAYVNEFQNKWIAGRRTAGEPLVGTSDIQSLADLGNSFAVVEQIRPFPFGGFAVAAVAVLVAVPILPLVLTMFSFQELVARLLGVLF